MTIQSKNLLQGLKILVAASGSIAAVKTPLLISGLIKAGAEVRSVITPSASKLVSALSLATLSRNKCYQDEDQWDPAQIKPLHIELAEWAEMVVIAPLTASTLSRWTQGLGEGLLASLLLAYEGPVIAAAGMNTSMWKNLAVKRNWEQLKQNTNVLCLNPASGLLACNRIGEGRMADPELIELAIKSGKIQINKYRKLNQDLEGLKILVTAGPTQEVLDPARVLTNKSSGRMGVLIAQAARFRGAEVDLIHGPLDLPEAWLEGLKSIKIDNAKEMRSWITKLQPSVDAVIMAAAVADLRKKDGPTKEKSSKKEFMKSLSTSLEEVPDLLKELVVNKTKKQILLGFAALSGSDTEIELAAKAKKIAKGCDLLMANPIDRPNQGFGSHPNGGFLIGANEMVRKIPTTSKIALAHELMDELMEHYRNISFES